MINYADIEEANAKTIQENNMEATHNIPVGTLCEFTYKEWFGKGACMAGTYRLYVVSHDRDCDGTPLYSLCQYPPGSGIDGRVIFKYDNEPQFEVKESIAKIILNNIISGIGEDQLKPIEVNQRILDGYDALTIDGCD
jgi:hypothetical protein